MISAKIMVNNKSGLHARPASNFVETAKKFDSEIYVDFNGKKKSAKSVIGILTLGIHRGCEIEVTADGKDEEQALETIVSLAKSNFNEEA